jgi:hypothetical protein
MPKVTLDQYLLPDLVFQHGDREYRVPPPSREDGLKMSAVVAMGSATYTAASKACPVCGRAGDVEFDPSIKPLLEDIKDQPLGVLTLGPKVYAQMNEDGMPEAHQDQYALYALYYWTMGKEAADANFEARYQSEVEDPAPKA